MQKYIVYAYLPLTAVLFLLSFHRGTRARILSCRPIRFLETLWGRLDAYYAFFFCGALLLGIAVRLYRFGELPHGVNIDEAYAGVEAYCLSMGGTDQYGTSWPTYFEAWKTAQMSTLYSYILMLFVKGMGLTIVTLRLPMVLTSIAMLLVSWDFARRIFGKWYALLVLLLVATCPWHIIAGRWALEANYLPHVLLMGMYLLFLGREKRLALYASMVVFALTPYAYGVACYITPIILVFSAGYYLYRGKVKVWDVAGCALVFFLIAGPYFYTMAINAFGWQTVTIGPFTLPHFSKSRRAYDMVFMQADVYKAMVHNLFAYLDTFLFMKGGEIYSMTPHTHTLYRFMPAVFVCGGALLWKKRRQAARRDEDSALRDASFLLFSWLFATLICGVFIHTNINRNNAIYYALLFLAAYGLWAMGKRIKTFLVFMVLLLLVEFSVFSSTYFRDTTYQARVGDEFNYNIQQALLDTWDFEGDCMYISTRNKGLDTTTAFKGQVMFAHCIDAQMHADEKPLNNRHGQPTGRYYSQYYKYVDLAQMEINPKENAVYVIFREDRTYFAPEEFVITDYDKFAVAIPRHSTTEGGKEK